MDVVYATTREERDMGHPKRHDAPGAWHHLMNRGVGHRTMFDDNRDARGFLALLAKVAHLELLHPVAFSLMPNHFHLLAWSADGRLSDAMRYIEGVYGRGFNRRYGRDGGLVKARYRSKLVESDAYRRALVGYIDQNPVDAGLVIDPRDYPFGSARLYARVAGPRWLSREWAEAYACRQSGLATFGPEAYDFTFGGLGGVARSRWLRATIDSPHEDDSSLDDLIRASPEYVRQWLDERAILADGARRGLPAADAESVAAVVAAAAVATPGWVVLPRRQRRPAWKIVEVGLLRELAGQTFRQVALRVSIPSSVALNFNSEHKRLMATDRAYGDVAAQLAQAAIRRCHGAPGLSDKSV